MLPGAENGLEVLHWRVADEPAAIGPAMARFGRPVSLSAATRERLRRNGLRLARIELSDAPALLEALGGSSIDLGGWLGQVYDWRELVTAAVGPRGRAVAIDGRPRRLHGGKLRMMLRGWTMRLEDGPFVYVQLRPEFDQSRPTRFERMLGQRPFTGVRFHDLAVELLFERGAAYVLTTAGPDDEWGGAFESDPAPLTAGPEAGEHDGTEDTEPDGAGGETQVATRRLGPRAEPLPTIGEMLLRSGAVPARRDVVVLVPRIPASLFAPEAGPPPEGTARRGSR